jgi:hypothetical protein
MGLLDAWISAGRRVSLGVCLPLIACAPGLSAQGSSGCRAEDQLRSLARLTFLKELASSSDSDYVSTRHDLGIPRMEASKVTLVTRRRDCQSAVTALNTVRQEPGTIRQVWLYALGKAGYAVDDPGLDRPYAARVMHFFDKTFKYKSTLVGF